MKAVVLCAGFGTRLGALTESVPKPLLDIGGTPLVGHIVARLAAQGFTEIGVNLHFRPELIRAYLGTGARWGVGIHYAYEPALLGTAGALTGLRSFLGAQPVLVHYGDILTDENFTSLLRLQHEREAAVTMLCHERRGSNSVVRFDEDGRVRRFDERPAHTPTDSYHAFSGVCVLAPEVVAAIPAGVPSDLPRQIFPNWVPTGRVYAASLSAYRCAIDSPERLASARQALLERRVSSPEMRSA